ncbi:MAG: hypothetical protein AAF730_05000 [Bacteroidota bacterium]
MNTYSLQRHFGRMGAALRVEVRSTGERLATWTYALDIETKRATECYSLVVNEAALDMLDILPVNARPDLRHLLLVVRMQTDRGRHQKTKLLCGHDERHWFVAAVNSPGVTTVADALDALKPPAVLRRQRQRGVRVRNWHKRRNAGFVRQGEWFFVPKPHYTVREPLLILGNEPLRRPHGKPHWVGQVYRQGGQSYYVCAEYPAGLTEAQYRRLLWTQPERGRLGWRLMRANSRVMARGTVRHPDHQTIHLPHWHEVHINNEITDGNVRYFD